MFVSLSNSKEVKVHLGVYGKERINIQMPDFPGMQFIDFCSFEVFAKAIYASYKKYSYVLKKEDKNGSKSNT